MSFETAEPLNRVSPTDTKILSETGPEIIAEDMPIIGTTPVIAEINTIAREKSSEEVDDGSADVGDTFYVVDMRSALIDDNGARIFRDHSINPRVSYLLVGQDLDIDKNKGFKGIRESDGEITFGRYDQETMSDDDYRQRFSTSATTSRDHFSLKAIPSGGLEVADLGSLNGSSLKVLSQEKSSLGQEASESIDAVRGDATEVLDSFLKSNADKEAMRYGMEAVRRHAEEIIYSGSEKNIRDVLDIVIHERLQGTEIVEMMGKWNFREAFDKRAKILDIYKSDTEGAEVIVSQQVAGFHGSRSGSLWGVLDHQGLLSAGEARRRGQILSSGERTFSGKDGQAFISFADLRSSHSIRQYAGESEQDVSIEELEERAAQYYDAASQRSTEQWSEDHPYSYNAKLIASDIRQQISYIKDNPDSIEADLMLHDFPVAYGVSVASYEVVPTVLDKKKGAVVARAPSDINGEFLVMDDHVGIANIPVIAVPSDRISQVEQLVKERKLELKVMDIDLLTRDPKRP